MSVKQDNITYASVECAFFKNNYVFSVLALICFMRNYNFIELKICLFKLNSIMYNSWHNSGFIKQDQIIICPSPEHPNTVHIYSETRSCGGSGIKSKSSKSIISSTFPHLSTHQTSYISKEATISTVRLLSAMSLQTTTKIQSDSLHRSNQNKICQLS